MKIKKKKKKLTSDEQKPLKSLVVLTRYTPSCNVAGGTGCCHVRTVADLYSAHWALTALIKSLAVAERRMRLMWPSSVISSVAKGNLLTTFFPYLSASLIADNFFLHFFYF